MSTKKANFLIKLDDVNHKNKLPISKSGVNSVAGKLYEDVIEGRTSAISLAEMFKFMEEVSKELKDFTDMNGKNRFVDLVRDEIVRNSDDGKSCVSRYGTKIELSENGTKYDYTSCNDPYWNYLNKELEALKKKMDKRQIFLRTIEGATPVGNVLNPDTGELHENVELYPPIKTSSSSYKQTFLKD